MLFRKSRVYLDVTLLESDFDETDFKSDAIQAVSWGVGVAIVVFAIGYLICHLLRQS